MKSRMVLFIVVCLSLTVNVYSQRKIITSSEFSNATEKAVEKSRVFPRRHIVTDETYVNGKLVKTSNLLWEAVSYEETRIVKTEKVADKITKLETIEIGSNVYKRENDGEWRKEEWYFEHGLTRQIVEYLDFPFEYSIEETVFDKQNTQIFECFSINKDALGRLTFEQKRHWISSSGVLLKQETTEGLLNPQSINEHRIFIYEYDPNIKIEAPTVSKETK